MTRKIIHIDMDAFYASIEQRDNPELQGKPVAVGGNRTRGVVAAASYEARKFGVKSALSSKIALQRCPDLIFVKVDMVKYKEVSNRIMKIFYEYTDLVEPLSIDEAFLDVTQNKKNICSATLIAKEIKQRIYDKTKLTASAGVSVNKFLAKIASDYDKPNGLFVIKPNQTDSFIKTLAVEKIYGVGKVTCQKMHSLGIKTGGDLKTKEKKWLIDKFGKAGLHFYNIARGVDTRAVNPNRIRKSVGAERTFEYDITDKDELRKQLFYVEKIFFKRMKLHKKYGRTLTLKVKYANFEQITRSKTLHDELYHFYQVHKTSVELLNSIDIVGGIRLLGLSITHFRDKTTPIQLTLNF